jgi:adenylate kinase
MAIQNFIILLGPPGSGKGTQGKRLAEKLNFSYVSMGQVLRKYSELESELGKKIKNVIDKGFIIPDEWIKVIFHEAMMSLPENTKGVVMDGFPRDLAQAPVMEDGIDKFKIINYQVVFLEVPKEVLLKRLELRMTKESRADDNPDVFIQRFKEYENKTLPLKDYYGKKDKLLLINGDQTPNEVFAEIESKLSINFTKK